MKCRYLTFTYNNNILLAVASCNTYIYTHRCI